MFQHGSTNIVVVIVYLFLPSAFSQSSGLYETGVTNTGPQPCPENPIIFTAKDTAQYIYSPYDDQKLYPPNCDCKFIIMARSSQHRIRITIIESKMEEPLFTDCNDYCILHDGNSAQAPEVVKWCGTESPIAVASSGDSLFLHFHSDSVVQKRGFNLSYSDYEIPDCPPEWLKDPNNIYCYKLVLPLHLHHGNTWMEAQRECNYERANLLTFDNSNEYGFIYETFSTSHTFPWIGYSDVNAEGVFESPDPTNLAIWPEEFPVFGKLHDERDCVFMDWNVRESVAYSIDDCRHRRSFLCKKRRDGTTVPVLLANKYVRSGVGGSTFNNIKYVLLLILLLILLIILLWCLLRYCKQKRGSARQVGNSDRNQRLVGSTATSTAEQSATAHGKGHLGNVTATSAPNAPSQKSGDSIKTTLASKTNLQSALYNMRSAETLEVPTTTAYRSQQNTEEDLSNYESQPYYKYQTEGATREDNTDNSPRISTSPNQPLPEQEIVVADGGDLSARGQVNVALNEDDEQLEQYRKGQMSVENFIAGGGTLNISADGNDVEFEQFKAAHQKKMDATMIRREGTMLTTTTTNASTSGGRQSTGIRSRIRRKSFDRPHISTLDNVSAISLDEFWRKSSS